MDRQDPLAVLDGEGRDHCQAVGPQEGGHLQILLQTRPGPRVGAGDDHTVFCLPQFHFLMDAICLGGGGAELLTD